MKPELLNLPSTLRICGGAEFTLLAYSEDQPRDDHGRFGEGGGGGQPAGAGSRGTSSVRVSSGQGHDKNDPRKRGRFTTHDVTDKATGTTTRQTTWHDTGHVEVHAAGQMMTAASESTPDQGGVADAPAPGSGAAGDAPDAKAKLKKFTMTAYTGVPMRLDGWPHPVVVDLQGMTVPNQSRPILMQHDSARVLGHSTKVEVTAQRLKLSGVLSGVGPHVDQVQAMAANGFPWQASIGASPDKMEFIARGESENVNGLRCEGPMYCARNTTLGEISFVPIGADHNSSTNIAAQAAQEEASTVEFTAWVQAQGFDPATLSAPQKAALTAAHAAATKPATPPTPPPDLVAEHRRAQAAETTRIERVRDICAQYGRPKVAVQVNGKEERVSLEAHAIAENWTLQQTELEALRAARPQANGIAAGGSSGPAGTPRILECALAMSVGIKPATLQNGSLGEAYTQETIAAAMSRDFRGFSLNALVHAVIRAAGLHARPGGLTDDSIRTGFQADQRLRAEGGDFSTLSLAGILSNVANKVLLQSFLAVKSVFPTIAAARDTNDFKAFFTYRMTGAGIFQKVGPDGELKPMRLTDAGYQNQLDTYGEIVTLTRQMQMNDDLGAFTQLPAIMGRGAGLAVEESGWTLLLSNPSQQEGPAAAANFFSAANANYATGGGSALSITALQAAEALFLKQVDAAGKPILVAPSILLVPAALKRTAIELMESDFIMQLVASKVPTRNTFSGNFTVQYSPYLDNGLLSGSSSTGWYLLADPVDCPIVQIGYLRGQRMPIIEPGVTDFDTLGMRWRGFFDWGVALLDHRGGVFSAGV